MTVQPDAAALGKAAQKVGRTSIVYDGRIICGQHTMAFALLPVYRMRTSTHPGVFCQHFDIIDGLLMLPMSSASHKYTSVYIRKSGARGDLIHDFHCNKWFRRIRQVVKNSTKITQYRRNCATVRVNCLLSLNFASIWKVFLTPEICDNFDKCRRVCYSPRKLSSVKSGDAAPCCNFFCRFDDYILQESF